MDNCPICLENPHDQPWMSLSCGHILHKRCFNEWVQQFTGGMCATCPTCRCPDMTLVSGWMNIMDHVHTRVNIKVNLDRHSIYLSTFIHRRRFNWRDEVGLELIKWHNVRLATLVGSINASRTLKQIKHDEVKEGEMRGMIMPFRRLECSDVRYSSIREWSRGEMTSFSKFLSEKGLYSTNLIEDKPIYWDGTIKDSEVHLELLKELTAVFEECC